MLSDKYDTLEEFSSPYEELVYIYTLNAPEDDGIDERESFRPLMRN